MRVSVRSIAVSLALILGLALVLPVFANGRSATITLNDTSKVSGTTLPPGDYKVVFTDSKVTFEHRGKVLAEATGQWKKAPMREYENSVVRDGDGRILEIHIQGHDSYFVVS